MSNDHSSIYLISATPADSWTSRWPTRELGTTRSASTAPQERGYDHICVIHPDGSEERVGWPNPQPTEEKQRAPRNFQADRAQGGRPAWRKGSHQVRYNGGAFTVPARKDVPRYALQQARAHVPLI